MKNRGETHGQAPREKSKCLRRRTPVCPHMNQLACVAMRIASCIAAHVTSHMPSRLRTSRHTLQLLIRRLLCIYCTSRHLQLSASCRRPCCQLPHGMYAGRHVAHMHGPFWLI